jgi:hypothetical protein
VLKAQGTDDTDVKRRARFDTELQLFKEGKLAFSDMPYLAELAMGYKENNGKMALEIAKTYKNNYLDKLSDNLALTKDHLLILATYDLIDSHDRYFHFLLEHPVMDEGLLSVKNAHEWLSGPQEIGYVIPQVIEKEDINGRLYDMSGKPVTSPAPDFKKIERSIRKKYPSINDEAEEIVLGAEIKYFKAVENWPAYCDAFIKKAERFGFASVVEVIGGTPRGKSAEIWLPNQLTASLVMHCSDPLLLNKAIVWENDCIIKWLGQTGKKWTKNAKDEFGISWSNDFGNYAGLLYKVGSKDEAINWMEFKVKLEEKAEVNKSHKDIYENAVEVLKRMKQGIPIDDSWNPRWFY